MPEHDVDTFHELCRTIERDCPNEYAKSYAHAGQFLSEAKAIRVQTLYILSNMQYWRGGQAKQIKSELRQFTR